MAHDLIQPSNLIGRATASYVAAVERTQRLHLGHLDAAREALTKDSPTLRLAEMLAERASQITQGLWEEGKVGNQRLQEPWSSLLMVAVSGVDWTSVARRYLDQVREEHQRV